MGASIGTGKVTELVFAQDTVILPEFPEVLLLGLEAFLKYGLFMRDDTQTSAVQCRV